MGIEGVYVIKLRFANVELERADCRLQIVSGRGLKYEP